jgi:hypothetical protein
VVVETIIKKKEITPYNLHEEFVKSVCSHIDKDAQAKRKRHSTGTEFQEDHIR